MEYLGLSARDVYLVHDELTGQTWRWGQHARPADPRRPGARSHPGPVRQAQPAGRIGMAPMPAGQ